MISSRPYQYTKGWTEFYKLKFKVTPDVLIPRPESELLVDEVLKFTKNKILTVLDVGTGSGNIAISIVKNNKKIKVFATDISEKALQVARKNAKLHQVLNKIKFIRSDLLSVIPAKAGIQRVISSQASLIIVTNLPYIPSERIPYLDSSVKDFEPHIALDGGKDGFDLYRKLFKQLRFHPRGVKLIICEIDYTHGELALHEAQKYFPEAQIEVKKDLSYKQRILIIRMEAHLK